jgi:putative transcriptional regulator
MKNSIRELREARGWSQTELGRQVGVTRQAILAIEKDKHDPSISLAARIAQAFGEPLERVFDLRSASNRS